MSSKIFNEINAHNRIQAFKPDSAILGTIHRICDSIRLRLDETLTNAKYNGEPLPSNWRDMEKIIEEGISEWSRYYENDYDNLRDLLVWAGDPGIFKAEKRIEYLVKDLLRTEKNHLYQLINSGT